MKEKCIANESGPFRRDEFKQVYKGGQPIESKLKFQRMYHRNQFTGSNDLLTVVCASSLH